MTRPTTLAALALVLLAGCGDGPSVFAKDAKADENETERATPVVTTTVKTGPIAARLTAASTIEAERMVTVHAESTGRIVALAFEEGDALKEGALLGRIKSDMQSSGLDRASTGLEKAKADLDTVEALYARNVASKQELDTAVGALRVAEADVAAGRAELDRVGQQVPDDLLQSLGGAGQFRKVRRRLEDHPDALLLRSRKH